MTTTITQLVDAIASAQEAGDELALQAAELSFADHVFREAHRPIAEAVREIVTRGHDPTFYVDQMCKALRSTATLLETGDRSRSSEWRS